METIRLGSPDDPRLDTFRLVAAPAELARRGLIVVEGRGPVEHLLADSAMTVEALLLTEAARLALSATLERAGAAVPVWLVPRAWMAPLTGFNLHRGCLAVARRPRPATLDRFVERGCRRLLVLEGVGNPDNVGGLFRTARAFGADGVVLGPGCGDPLYRKAIRVSCGAALLVPFAGAAERWPEGLESAPGGGPAAGRPHPPTRCPRDRSGCRGSSPRNPRGDHGRRRRPGPVGRRHGPRRRACAHRHRPGRRLAERDGCGRHRPQRIPIARRAGSPPRYNGVSVMRSRPRPAELHRRRLRRQFRPHRRRRRAGPRPPAPTCVVLSELATTGYPPRDLLTHGQFVEANLALLDRVAALSDDLARHPGRVRRAEPGRRRQGPVQRRRALRRRPRRRATPQVAAAHLRRLRRGPVLRAGPPRSRLSSSGASASASRSARTSGTTRDFWPRRLLPPRSGRRARAGPAPTLFVNISSSPFTLGKAGAAPRHDPAAGASSTARSFLYLNQVGGNDELIFDGALDRVRAADGALVRAGARLRRGFPRHDVPTPDGGRAGRRRRVADVSAIAGARRLDSALVLGLRDYARKCGFTDASWSGCRGGIDSALTAALAAEALGPERVLGVVDAEPVLVGAQRWPTPRRSRGTWGSATASMPDRRDLPGATSTALRAGLRRAAARTSPRRTSRRASAARC